LIKIFRKLPTSEQLFRQKPGGLKPRFYGGRCILPSKGGLPTNAYFQIFCRHWIGVVFLFVSDAYFGDNESNSRFNGSLYESAIYAPRLEETVATKELHFTRDATPAARVKEVFAQFVPNEGKRGKRYSSTATVVQ
jgi:hypothetical protein